MERWKQYAGLTSVIVVSAVAAVLGFRASGGSVPYAKRFATSIQEGVQSGGGSLVDPARGILLAGPIRNGGMVLEWLALVAALTVAGIALYVYVDRYDGFGGSEEVDNT